MSTPKRGTQVTADDTVKLLVSCIRHSVSGKINFKSVGEDCDCTANAAQKRYKKIITTYDVSTPVGSGSGSGRDPSTTPSQKAGNKGQKGGAVSASAGPSASKKRKHQQFDEGSDEEEEQVEQKVKVKAEPATADDGGDVNFDDFVEDFTA